MANIIVNTLDGDNTPSDVTDPLQIPSVTIGNFNKVTVNGRLVNAQSRIVSCIITRLTDQGGPPSALIRFSEAVQPDAAGYFKWSLVLEDLEPGNYLVIASAPMQEIGCVKLVPKG